VLKSHDLIRVISHSIPLLLPPPQDMNLRIIDILETNFYAKRRICRKMAQFCGFLDNSMENYGQSPVLKHRAGYGNIARRKVKQVSAGSNRGDNCIDD